MINFLLLVASIILLAILLLPAFVYGLISDRKKEGSYFLNLAESIDRFGNALCAPLFNELLISVGGYPFGNKKETISSVLGKNDLKNTLTKKGMWLVNLLNKLQKNHCIISIDNNV